MLPAVRLRIVVLVGVLEILLDQRERIGVVTGRRELEIEQLQGGLDVRRVAAPGNPVALRGNRR